MNLFAVSFRSVPVRLAAAAAACLVLLISLFAFIWGFASAASSNAEFKEVADLLSDLSPSDPQTHFASGSLHEKALEPGDLEIALREYEIAASLAPHNYLLWLRLAAVRGRAGDSAGAEAALRQAHRLAPNYYRVQWALGNFLLREGRDEEAYEELRKAVAGDPTLAPLAAATSLQMFEGDADAAAKRFENSAAILMSLAALLAKQNRFDEALEMWKTIPLRGDDSYIETAKQIKSAMVANKRFALAVAMRTPENSNEPALETITNGGFEQPIKTQEAGPFEWKIAQGAYPQIGVTDGQKISGNYSLIVLLGSSEPKEFRGPSQLVAVRPGVSYELVFPYRSDARSSAAYQWEVVSATDGKRLAITPPLEPTLEWANAEVNFAVPAECEGIEIKLVRSDCIGSACSATGSFWFDDISIEPV